MERGPAIQPDLVFEFVRVAHGDLTRVTQLLESEPMLANATWDWGDGDWETGLGAAAHTGQKDIARYLLERGARLDIFAAAMLGELDIVTAIVRAFPATRAQRGPHGIPLIAHARVGGEAAAAVLNYLQELEAEPASAGG